MTTHEVRFRGELLAHFTQEEATRYAEKRASEGGDPEDWTVAPRRPVELHEAGSLADTFDSVGDAEARAAAIVKARVSPRGGFKLATPVVIDTRTSSPLEERDPRSRKGGAVSRPASRGAIR